MSKKADLSLTLRSVVTYLRAISAKTVRTALGQETWPCRMHPILEYVVSIRTVVSPWTTAILWTIISRELNELTLTFFISMHAMAAYLNWAGSLLWAFSPAWAKGHVVQSCAWSLGHLSICHSQCIQKKLARWSPWNGSFWIRLSYILAHLVSPLRSPTNPWDLTSLPTQRKVS